MATICVALASFSHPGQGRAFELVLGLAELGRVDAVVRFGVIHVRSDLTQVRDRDDRARVVLVETWRGTFVDDGVAALRVLDWVPDFQLPIAPVVVVHCRALYKCELEAGCRLVCPQIIFRLVALFISRTSGVAERAAAKVALSRSLQTLSS